MQNQESSPFLKKGTQKLLLNSQKFFASFFQKRSLLAFLTLTPLHRAHADAASVGTGSVTAAQGAAIYQHVCQGCHMPGGRGAIGAGAFPKLAGNEKLAVSGYPISMVLNGHGGMPWFNGTLSDVQIASVINFVRTNFGNQYQDAVTPADVTAARGPVPTLER